LIRLAHFYGDKYIAAARLAGRTSPLSSSVAVPRVIPRCDGDSPVHE